MGKQPRTLLELCVARAGGGWRDIPRGSRICTFVCEWAVASWDLGGDVDMPTFCRWWKLERDSAGIRLAYRHLDEFRALFPEHDTPQPLVDALPAPARVPSNPASVMSLAVAA